MVFSFFWFAVTMRLVGFVGASFIELGDWRRQLRTITCLRFMGRRRQENGPIGGQVQDQHLAQCLIGAVLPQAMEHVQADNQRQETGQDDPQGDEGPCDYGITMPLGGDVPAGLRASR
jgi:hypothetical protein